MSSSIKVKTEKKENIANIGKKRKLTSKDPSPSATGQSSSVNITIKQEVTTGTGSEKISKKVKTEKVEIKPEQIKKEEIKKEETKQKVISCLRCKIYLGIEGEDDSRFGVQCDQCGKYICNKCYPKEDECGACEKYFGRHTCADCCVGKCIGRHWSVCESCYDACTSGNCEYCEQAKRVIARKASKKIKTEKKVEIKKEKKEITCKKCKISLGLDNGEYLNDDKEKKQCEKCGIFFCINCCRGDFHFEGCGPCADFANSFICVQCCVGKCKTQGSKVCVDCKNDCLTGHCLYCNREKMFRMEFKMSCNSDDSDDDDDFYSL